MASLHEDIQRVYELAEKVNALSDLMEAICAVLDMHDQELRGVTYRYRLCATDTGYGISFGLRDGRMERLDPQEAVDVTVSGQEADLLQVMRRKLAPLKAVLLGKIKLKGDRAALTRLGEFLE